MLSLVLTLALALPQDPPAPAPDREAVAAAVAGVARALGGKETAPKVEAIRAAAELAHADVVRAIAKGLKHEREVQEAALEALRWMEHPAALKALHTAYRRDEALVEDEELAAILLKSIGQHGSPSSIAILADEPFGVAHRPSITASILGLGRVRDRRAVEALIGMMQLVAPQRVEAHAEDFRLALCALTGVDRGRNPAAWTAWWREHGRDFELPAATPRLSEDQQLRWDLYWGQAYEVGRQKRREDRGDDPERG